MTLEEYFDFLPSGAIRIKGHRIGLEHVLAHYLDGYHPEEIATAFPGLSLEVIHATITYYLHNFAAVTKYMRQIEEEAEADRQARLASPSPLRERMQAARMQRDRERERDSA